MWSLYNKKEEDSGSLGIFEYTGNKLEPLLFSNGKSQADIVKEALNEIEKGNKIIFIRGVCGTGKSAIALNLARHFKKTSIVVPIKTLQEQYETDYTKKKFILKKDKNKLKIAVIKGRNNFECPFSGGLADEPSLPCIIELRERNMDKIKEYIELNENVSKLDFTSISDVRRMSVAPCCPYWSPILPKEVSSKALQEARKRIYTALNDKKYCFYCRKKGCGYYDQYHNYLDADVLIFNSMKYMIETFIGRKPKTDLDVIDECDEFLDKFTNERKIYLNRLVSSLSNISPKDNEEKKTIKELIYFANSVIFNFKEGVEKVRDTEVLRLLKKIIDSPYLAEEEDNSYYNSVFEIAKSFENLLKETYVSVEKMYGDQEDLLGRKEEKIILNLVSINLEQRFKDIIEANNVLVLMSGTLHSEDVLKDVFGLKNFKIIEAEAELPGEIVKCRTGLEKDFKYANFKSRRVTREDYLKALDKCIEVAKPPVLIHVNSFEDLPSEIEIKEYGLKKLISKEKLKQIQGFNSSNIDKFREGELDLLFTTKCSRGVDFPGDKCNSIILTKYPYPNIRGLFWQILKKERPNQYFKFYIDKANRELIQKIARAIRFKGDKVDLYSPDIRVLNAKIG